MAQRGGKNHGEYDTERREIGLRMKKLREALPEGERQLKDFAEKVRFSESQLSKIEAGKMSLGLDAVAAFATAYGCRIEAITSDNPYPDSDAFPFQETVAFLRQAQDLGIDGLFRDRESSLDHLLSFARKMRSGKIYITASSLRGLEQKSEHAFVHCLREFGADPHFFEVKVIMTHPELGSAREHQEHRPSGSITREILANIVWCLDFLHVKPANLRLSTVSPSSFCIFLLDGPEGRGIINPYPIMRQAYLSYTLAVRMVQPGKGAGAAASIFQTYLEANFRNPWEDSQLTESLEGGLSRWRKAKGSDEFQPYLDDVTKYLAKPAREPSER